MTTPAGRTIAAAAALVATAALAGCGAHHHLDEYDFTGRTLAVTYFPAPAPDLRTGGVPLNAIGDRDGIGVLVKAGSRIAEEVEARRARARLDSASTHIDLANRMADRTLQRAAVYLGARPVEERADGDFLLEVDIRSLGIDTRGDLAYLFVNAEAVLLDARTGREIWSEGVHGNDPLTPDTRPGGIIPTNAVTAGALSTLSVDDYRRLLGTLADYSADTITRELRNKLRHVRD